ncbi:unnamed protein product [Penicillium salamii]|uniref:Uncharacterized protein n=1 Tax=Penicillium salamii TaxID=1612424 RepID=A0A9W4JYE2_9EURO|nr:unnamed protein product [Penicillium salamii]CAG8288765.1 unnamed protein product [Penicillium salamii]CAG8308707.1 unnamed protein product [Penicillium salamii]CAG8316867.1 unnamed protein product [Penicillium salamii]CAG8317566.1 unnamed protein product [Penicillium salamii]
MQTGRKEPGNRPSSADHADSGRTCSDSSSDQEHVVSSQVRNKGLPGHDEATILLSDVSTWSRHDFWSECVSLSPENDVEVEWKAAKEHGHTLYVALLEPRLSLPSHRSYPPTFHSCLVSRAYASKATLVYGAHGRKQGSSRLSISVPVEICAT